MTVELMMLGGAEEIGANSCYVNIGGTGIIIDAGLHPRRRDELAFPQMQLLGERPADAFVLTHAHTDHLGGVPYMMKFQPHVRMIATRPTRDLVEIMLRNTIKLLNVEQPEGLPKGALSLYDWAILDKFSMVFEGFKYEEDIAITPRRSFYEDYAAGNGIMEDVKVTLHDAGHILGSAGVLMQSHGAAIMHTGDVQFARQSLLPGASFPRHHMDILISESTNGADTSIKDSTDDRERLAAFINEISGNGGSVLLPVFALGKTQEVLNVVHKLMMAGKIPKLPMYTGGMGVRVSRVYDRYCYAVPRVEPGFELADIPQNSLVYSEMMKGKYFKEPSIVIISSGMLNVGSPSYLLAQRWMEIGSFGIGIVGYQDPSTPGYELLQSKRGEDFVMAGKVTRRKCDVQRFRFSAHSPRELLLDYIFDVRPKHLFLIHGDIEATQSMAEAVQEQLPQTSIIIPKLGSSYTVEVGR
jgi:Cft2 family RNA processing exonuclease